jgi:hypothetical protein
LQCPIVGLLYRPPERVKLPENARLVTLLYESRIALGLADDPKSFLPHHRRKVLEGSSIACSVEFASRDPYDERMRLDTVALRTRILRGKQCRTGANDWV